MNAGQAKRSPSWRGASFDNKQSYNAGRNAAPSEGHLQPRGPRPRRSVMCPVEDRKEVQYVDRIEQVQDARLKFEVGRPVTIEPAADQHVRERAWSRATFIEVDE